MKLHEVDVEIWSPMASDPQKAESSTGRVLLMQQVAEVWREIPGVPGCYASTFGQIKAETGNIQKPMQITHKSSNTKYWFVRVRNKSKSVHRLVARTFIGKSKKTVNHKDLNKSNNAVWNLEYKTLLANVHHYNASINRHVLTDAEVREIRLLREQQGLTLSELARRFNSSAPTICNIVNYHSRRTVK